MKALLVCASPAAGAADLVARLVTDADLVVGVDGGGSLLAEAGVRPDLLLGDFDSLDPETLARFEGEGVGVVRFPAEKDATDLELALDRVRVLGATEVTVTAAFSGRLDHTLAAVFSIAGAADLSPAIVEPGLQAWVLSPGGRTTISLTGTDATLSLLPLGGAARVSIDGVRWPLDRALIAATSSLGMSNRITSSLATATVHEGVVLIAAPAHLGGPPVCVARHS